MTSIFISYSSKDRIIASAIAQELRARGAEVFLDYQKLMVGDSFIGRLGEEIEKRDYFLLLLSPNAVASEWVKREAGWALHLRKAVRPVLLDNSTSLVEFFWVASLDHINLAHWESTGRIEDEIRELALSMGLPAAPIAPVEAAQIPPSPIEDDPTPAPSQALSLALAGDLSEMFMAASEIGDDNPEGAVFLYQRVLELDPNYLKGQARAFVERESKRLLPLRLAKMQAQAEAAMRAGQWERGAQIAGDMLRLDAQNAIAPQIIATCGHNQQCEPIYQLAVQAAQQGRWKASLNFLRQVRQVCPEYGRPQGESFRLNAETCSALIEIRHLQGHGHSVNSLAFSPNGSRLASGSADKTIKLWDVREGRLLSTLQEHGHYVYSVAFSPDGSRLASGSGDKTIKLWDVREGRLLSTLQGHGNLVSSVAFSPDGSRLASGSNDNTIKLWDVREGRLLSTLQGHGNFVISVAFSPDGSRLASGSDDQTIKLWDVREGRLLSTLQGHGNSVISVAFSPDGSRLASGSRDKTIKLWEFSSGRLLSTLQGHGNSVISVAFSPGGSLLASGSYDKTIKLWEFSSGRLLSTLQGHGDYVFSVAFSPDGSRLASGSADQTIKLWGL
jgi:WD40 repeat protein